PTRHLLRHPDLMRLGHAPLHELEGGLAVLRSLAHEEAAAALDRPVGAAIQALGQLGASEVDATLLNVRQVPRAGEQEANLLGFEQEARLVLPLRRRGAGADLVLPPQLTVPLERRHHVGAVDLDARLIALEEVTPIGSSQAGVPPGAVAESNSLEGLALELQQLREELRVGRGSRRVGGLDLVEQVL